jgi:hypothetical protein
MFDRNAAGLVRIVHSAIPGEDVVESGSADPAILELRR